MVTHVAPDPHVGYAEPLAHLTDGQIARVVCNVDTMFESGDSTHVRVLSSLEDWTHNGSLITRLTKERPRSGDRVRPAARLLGDPVAGLRHICVRPQAVTRPHRPKSTDA
jgi:hypothetical protein